MRKLLSRGCACLFYTLLLIVLALALALWILQGDPRTAQAATLQRSVPQAESGTTSAAARHADTNKFDVVLLIDQSLSMWECSGPGSDPEQVRVDAANLIIQYLGADSSNANYRIGIVHFGGSAVQMAPLTDVGIEEMRQQLAGVILNPEPIPWTNPEAAMLLAHDMLARDQRTDGRRVVVLLTDGEPIWPDNQPMTDALYRQQLQSAVDQFVRDDIELVLVQLTNPATTCNQNAIAEWLVTWQTLVEQTGDGVQ